MSSLYEDIPAVGATEPIPAAAATVTTTSTEEKQKQPSLFKPRQSIVKPAAPTRRPEERGRRSKTDEGPREEEEEEGPASGGGNDDGDGDEEQAVFDQASPAFEYDPLSPNNYIVDYCHARLSALRQKRLEESNERIRQEREQAARDSNPFLGHPGLGRNVNNLPAWMTKSEGH